MRWPWVRRARLRELAAAYAEVVTDCGQVRETLHRMSITRPGARPRWVGVGKRVTTGLRPFKRQAVNIRGLRAQVEALETALDRRREPLPMWTVVTAPAGSSTRGAAARSGCPGAGLTPT
jgi:hypothetical protein